MLPVHDAAGQSLLLRHWTQTPPLQIGVGGGQSLLVLHWVVVVVVVVTMVVVTLVVVVVVGTATGAQTSEVGFAVAV